MIKKKTKINFIFFWKSFLKFLIIPYLFSIWCLELFEEIVFILGDLTPALIMGLGLIVGIEHAFEPDHVAAVGTQLFKRKSKNGIKTKLKTAFRKSSLVGISWGVGHTTTLVFVGFLAYFFTINATAEIYSGLELIVGVMLIFLGITAIRKNKFKIGHIRLHPYSDEHLNFGAHEYNDIDRRHKHKSYLIGLIHGLAGSGSLIALTATTLDNVELALIFILLFGLGSIIGMIIVGGLIVLPVLLTDRISLINQFFKYGASTISIILGIRILFEIDLLSYL